MSRSSDRYPKSQFKGFGKQTLLTIERISLEVVALYNCNYLHMYQVFLADTDYQMKVCVEPVSNVVAAQTLLLRCKLREDSEASIDTIYEIGYHSHV